MQAADHQVVDRSIVLLPFYVYVQHWTEQVSCNYTEINEWLLAQRISAPGVLVHNYMGIGRECRGKGPPRISKFDFPIIFSVEKCFKMFFP